MESIKKAALIALLLLSQGAMAEMFKWVDADGKISYSDQPPPKNVKEQKVQIKISPAPTPVAPVKGDVKKDGKDAKDAKPSGPKTSAEQDLDFRKRKQEAADAEAKSAKEAEDAKQGKENCSQAKIQLASLKNGDRATKKNAAGETVYLDDTGRQKQIQETEKAVASWCK